MKKIIALVILTSAIAAAGVKTKVFVSSVVLVATGALFLPGLVIGDAQWQAYTNKGKCDSNHTIYSTAPQTKDGILGRIRFAIPCDEWYPKTEPKFKKDKK